MTQVLVRGWQNELAELVKIEHAVLSAIVLTDDILTFKDSCVDVILASEVVQFSDTDETIAVAVDLLEELVWLKVWVSC